MPTHRSFGRFQTVVVCAVKHHLLSCLPPPNLRSWFNKQPPKCIGFHKGHVMHKIGTPGTNARPAYGQWLSSPGLNRAVLARWVLHCCWYQTVLLHVDRMLWPQWWLSTRRCTSVFSPRQRRTHIEESQPYSKNGSTWISDFSAVHQLTAHAVYTKYVFVFML